MGGDHGPGVTLPACKAFLDRHPGAKLLLVGQPAALAAARGWSRCEIVAASEVVAMDDTVEIALRRKRDSSMRVAVNLLKAAADPNPEAPGRPRADVCVSAGNTGALMAVSRFVLKTLEGIDRPAIATVMPNTKQRFTTVLDLGANVDCTPEHLLQFALMGSALVAAVDGIDNPTVGLLNIGEEAIKGSEVIKQAGELLREAGQQGRLQFFGNVEGNDIFKGTTDIVVCDGFVGNIALKTSEGLASMLSAFIREEFTRGLYSQLAAIVALPVLNRLKRRVDHRRYNGAALLGLRGLVFKSHGSADAFAFEQALNRAYEAAAHQLLDRVRQRIQGDIAPASASPSTLSAKASASATPPTAGATRLAASTS
jgi:phosphate acyltransferase